MDKKAKFFRNIVANTVMAAVLVVTIVFVAFDNAAAVPADDPINKGNAPQTVSVMFDVYVGSENLDEILRILGEHSVTATFFVGGSWVAENNHSLKKLHEAGHEIGNHGFFNKDHKVMSAERSREEIELTHKLVKSIVGIDMNLFLPPSGSFSQTTLSVAKQLGYRTVLWSKNTQSGTVPLDAEQIFLNAVTGLDGGELILLHPTRETASVLGRILDAIADKELKLDAVGKVIGNE